MSTEWAFMAGIALFLVGVCFIAVWMSWMDRREDQRVLRFLEDENYRQWRLTLQDQPLEDTFPEEWTRV